MKHILLFSVLAFGSLAACKRDAEDLPIERPFTRDFYSQGEWRDTNQTAFAPFDHTVGRTIRPPFSNVFSCNSETKIVDGYKTIQGNILGISSSAPAFYVRFFSDAPAASSSSTVWSAAEIETLLPPGRIFPIAGAAREVEIGLAIPFDDLFDIYSDTRGAPSPDGWVQVLDVADYTWIQTRFDGTEVERRGKQVRIAFQAKLGRRHFFSQVGPVVGEAEVRNGEASLCLEYF
ncbi:MAG: hypothetical protein IPM98_09000 [Lewinellaceae bacterium]|nr:hypothetical protein [Lewinellaceae bacterium]